MNRYYLYGYPRLQYYLHDQQKAEFEAEYKKKTLSEI